MPPFRLLVLIAGLLAATLAWATQPASERWFEILIDDRKIGHAHWSREAVPEGWRTTQRTQIELLRDGVPLLSQSEDVSIEDQQGLPLAFESRSALGGSELQVVGERGPNGMRLREHGAAGARRPEFHWPPEALLPEGQRLAMLARGVEPGTRYLIEVFLPAAMAAATLETEVLGAGVFVLGGTPLASLRLRHRLSIDGSVLDYHSEVDQDFVVLEQRMPALGQTLVYRACSERCALAPNDPDGVFASALVDAPPELANLDLAARLDLVVELDQASGQRPPDSSEQAWLPIAGQPGRYLVRIDPAGGLPAPAGDGDPAQLARYLAPGRWVESDAREIRRLAREARRGAGRDPLMRMRYMEAFVRGYIRTKSLGVGYASALETLRSREGDCTEHAVLLAALARAEGIPARIVFGLVYQPSFGARERVFVPHAWVQAFVDGRWMSFDASQPAFGAGHIALGHGDGDPMRFHAGANLLGQLRLISAAPGATP